MKIFIIQRTTSTGKVLNVFDYSITDDRGRILVTSYDYQTADQARQSAEKFIAEHLNPAQ